MKTIACFVALFVGLSLAAPSGIERNIKIINESGSRVEIYWIHPQTREASLMSSPDVQNGATFPLNSFVGHEFEVREKPSASTGVCKSADQTCKQGFFKVSENDDQLIEIKPGIDIRFVDDQIRAQEEAGDLVDSCKQAAKARLEAAGKDPTKAMEAIELMTQCVEGGVAQSISRANEEISFQKSIREQMAKKMENYTCVDPELNTTDPVREEVWAGAADRRRRKVKIMLDRPASRIHVIENFINPDECAAMEESAEPRLHRATVADGKGGSHFSEHRKAMQAGIKVPWDKEEEGNAIARISRRVYDYNNHVLGLDIDEFGQEDLMSIQYFGRGKDDDAPDRYTPHCDGDCTGLPHKFGTRMATMVMYW
jgi:hypothetical protein